MLHLFQAGDRDILYNYKDDYYTYNEFSNILFNIKRSVLNMAGGTWTSQNKVRPGAYINVEGRQTTTGSEEVTGVVLLPVAVSWGPVGVPIDLTGSTNFLQTFGKSVDDPELLTIREALRNASTVKTVRLGGGTKAITGVDSVLDAEALYPGTVGNDINLKVFVRPGATNNQLVIETYLRYTASGEDTESLVYSQSARMEKDGSEEDIIPGVEVFNDNPFVEITAINSLPATASTLVMTGGTSIAPTTDVGALITAMETVEFNMVAWPFDSSPDPLISAVRRLREDEGKKVQLVIGAPIDPTGNVVGGADYEGVIQIANGVILEDGTELAPHQCTAFVAGASANAGVAFSLTYSSYAGATESTPKYNNEKIIELLQNGYMLFVDKRGQAVIEQDINSLVTFTGTKGRDFTKNRVIRTLDFIANDSKQSFEDNFIGQVNNTVNGRELFKADRIAAFDALQGQGAIQGFTPNNIVVKAGTQRDGVYLHVDIQPVDAMEKLYMTVKVV